MAVEKRDVLTALARVTSPDGVALPATGKLSDVIVTDGKVFFSLTVDAALVPSWEPVRKAAEVAVRAVPGVVSAMVALTGERSAGARPQTAGPAARPCRETSPGCAPSCGHARSGGPSAPASPRRCDGQARRGGRR